MFFMVAKYCRFGMCTVGAYRKYDGRGNQRLSIDGCDCTEQEESLRHLEDTTGAAQEPVELDNEEINL